MEERVSITLSFCEKCGSKVSSRNEVCSKCGTFPYQDDRNFRTESNIPDELHYDDWSDELYKKFDEWLESSNVVNYCKDCGMSVEEVEKFDFNVIVDENTGEVISENNHPCNPNSPIFE